MNSELHHGRIAAESKGIGVYASVSRSRAHLRSSMGNDTSNGPWIQVNRLVNPLFNRSWWLAEQDNYNGPSDGRRGPFATYALNPEIAVLINTVFGTAFQTDNRVDLQAIYIPDVIRVNTTTGAVPVSARRTSTGWFLSVATPWPR